MNDTMIDRVALGDMLRRAAAKFGTKIALVDGDRRMSFSELDRAANRFAHQLVAKGLKPGDKVVTLAGNSADLLVVLFGILKAGMVWVPINIMLGRDDAAYIVEHSAARLVVADPVCARLAPEGANILLLSDLDAGQPATEPDVTISDRDLAMIIYTSGTTARPKGVMHTHLSVYFGTLSNGIAMTATDADVGIAVLPLVHCGQLSNTLTLLAVGARSVILRGFDPVAMLAAIAAEKATFLVGLPMMYGALYAHPARASTDLSSLRTCVYAMAPMSHALLETLMRDFCPDFVLASGQTEAWPVTVSLSAEWQMRKDGNYWGEPSPACDLAIMDDAGNLLQQGEIGEIVHRGPNIMAGYYLNDEATAEARKFGWHHTGDLGRIDADGQLEFLDRKKDMIKTGGENVPTIKVEQALVSHPAVFLAAAAGLPHARWAEAVTGFVMLKPGASATEGEIIAHCEAHLSHFEVPKRVIILPVLPMTPTGKVKKADLRAEYRGLYGG